MTHSKLSLKEAIQDNPQTQAVLTICEEDAQLLRKFTHEFHGYCDKIHTAQLELAAASHGLAALMKKYNGIKFPLEKPDSCMATTFPLLAEYMEEVGTMQQLIASQISDTMLSPISRFISADLEELSQLQNLYWLISDEHELSVQKYMKLSQRCSEQERCDAIDEVFHMRKKLHRTSLHYFSSMNLVQRKRQFVFLESLAGHLQAHLALFKRGSDYADRQELDTLHGTTKGLLLCGQRELDLERAGASGAVASLEAAYDDSVYQPEPPLLPPPADVAPSGGGAPPKRKSGHLMQRCRPAPLASRWDRLYFRTSRGRLTRQGRRQAQPACLLDLRRMPGLAAAPAEEVDDRRHVFVVRAPGLSPVTLQAESAQDRAEWVAVINAIAAGSEEDDEDSDDEEISEAEAEVEEGAQQLLLDVADRSVALLEDGGGVAGAGFSRTFQVRLLGDGRCAVASDEAAAADAVLRVAASVTATSGSVGGDDDCGERLVLAVSEHGVWLVEPRSRLMRCDLPLSRALAWAAGRRLLGLAGRRRGSGDRRLDCLALRLCDGQTAEAACAAVSAAARSAGLGHDREMALLLSNIDRLPDASSDEAEAPRSPSSDRPPRPPPRQQRGGLEVVALADDNSGECGGSDEDADADAEGGESRA